MIPPEHFTLVGPLWSRFEGSLHDSGASGESAEEMINSLRNKVSRELIDRMHYVRMERNALNHFPARPLADPQRWESWCKEAISALSDSDESSTGAGENATNVLVKVALWGFGAYVVLTNERLMEILLLGGLCYLGYKAFASSK